MGCKSLFRLGLLWFALPAIALPTPSQATEAVYQALPDLPKGPGEGKQNLIRRLITYHDYIKGRSSYARFDWKLTLADYLGYNDPIRPEEYPGREDLPSNPYLADQRLIDQLTRSQREVLIQTLLKIYRTPAP